MSIYTLRIRLLSDATFGRGDGVAGLVDHEVEHDAFGFPYLRGRTLKGLLSDECDTILQGLGRVVPPAGMQARHRLFGIPGSTEDTASIAHFANACLPAPIRHATRALPDVPPGAILEALTTIRRQTALDDDGVPGTGSLRSVRVVIRDLSFDSHVTFQQRPGSWDLMVLAVSCAALRRLGIGRNRGRGMIRCALYIDQQDCTINYLHRFERELEARI